MKKIICPHYIENAFLKSLFKNNNFIENCQIMPLQSALLKNRTSEHALFLMAFQTLQKNNTFKMYHNMIQYPSFVMEMVSFFKTLCLYQIDVSTLPEKDKSQQELKGILSLLNELDFNEKHMTNTSLDGFEAVSFFARNPFEQSIKEKLPIIPLSKHNTPKATVQFGLTLQEEIEAICQLIVKKQSAHQTTLVLSDATAMPHLIAILNRYQIPIQQASYHTASMSVYIFKTLVEYAKENTPENLEKVCAIYGCSSSVLNQETLTPIQTTLQADIEKLQNTPFHEYLQVAYEILITNTFFANDAVKEIQTILEDTLLLAKEKEDYDCILSMIENVSKSVSIENEEGVIVTTLSQPVFENENVFVIGCNSKVFPGFKALSGIFDEIYVKEIEKFPSLQERFDCFQQNIQWIQNSAKNNILYTYHKSTMTGKKLDSAIELDNIQPSENHTRLAIQNTSIFHNKDHIITSNHARSLFLNNNILSTSASGMEEFEKCPYRFFLNHGLKLKEKEQHPLTSNITIGNIMHQCMKLFYENNEPIHHLLNTLKEEYLKTTDNRLVELVFQQMEHNINLNLKALQYHSDDFKPTYFEHVFNDFKLTENVHIKGIMDRCDVFQNTCRIIDYKSGKKVFTANTLNKKDDFQIAIYAIVASTIFHLEVAGAFYYSFKNDTFEDTLHADANLSEFYKSKKLVGIFFQEADKEVKSKIKGLFNADMQLVSEIIQSAADNMFEYICTGHFNATGKDCNICPYLSICRYAATVEGGEEDDNL